MGFLSAVRYPFRGARFVFVEHRGLARFWLPPIAITGCALVGVIAAAVEYHDDVVALLWTAPVGEGAWAATQRVLHAALEWLVGAGMIVLGIVAVAMLTSLIAAPFNDALSEAVECLERSRSPDKLTLGKLLRDAKRTVGLELLKLGAYAAIMFPLFLVSVLLPGVGPVVYSVAGFTLTVLFFSIDYVDWPASRRDLPLRRRLALARANLGSMFGLGLGIWVMLFIPFLNLLFMPAAVAGATLMFLDLHDLPDDTDT